MSKVQIYMCLICSFFKKYYFIQNICVYMQNILYHTYFLFSNQVKNLKKMVSYEIMYHILYIFNYSYYYFHEVDVPIYIMDVKYYKKNTIIKYKYINFCIRYLL